MKISLILALAYIAPALLLLVFAQGGAWLYVFPITLVVAGGFLSGIPGANHSRT